MECVEEAKALKISFRHEVVVKPTQQVFSDDGFGENGPCGVPADEFFVDSLLDFSSGDVNEGFVEEEEEKDHSFSSQEQAENDNNSNSNSGSSCVIDDFGSVPGNEPAVPADDMADLEWLSNFVEDSFSEFSLLYPIGNQTTKTQIESENRSESRTRAPSPKPPCFPTPIPTKARSKRSRTGERAWSIGSPSFTESSSTTSSSSSSSSSSPSFLVFLNPGQILESSFNCAGKSLVTKRRKKKSATEAGGTTQLQRRCSHCHVQKTPQWRTGPLGAKTLCNACGVRYKSGRLLAEYRPARSPTFSCDVHSNNHRKVLEMRRKREVTGPEPGLAPELAHITRLE